MGKNILIVTLLLLTLSHADGAHWSLPFAISAVPQNCPNVDMPVCGLDGRSYQNECKAIKAGTKKAYDGWCTNASFSNDPSGYKAMNNSDFVKDARNGFLPVGRPFDTCACNSTLNPICGVNGITYANYCRAACHNIMPAHYGQCGALSYEYDSKAICECDYANSPVCGKNGITLENVCTSKCFNTVIASNGMCVLPCSCSFYYNPVCGENGKNYANECLLDCAHVSKFSNGLCSNETKCGKCYGDIKRVCGQDDKTYDNECYLECAGVKKLHDGYCVERLGNQLYDPFSGAYMGYSVLRTERSIDDFGKCFCPKNYLPVCGTDNVTYLNECEINCAGARKARNGACDHQDAEDACTKKSKIRKYKPVCGSNRVTYYNKEMIGCESGVSVLYEGECKPIYYEWCKCSTNYRPVCGVDGRTYLNENVLQCVGVKKYCDGSCELGAKGWKVGPEQKGRVGADLRADQDDRRFDEDVNEYWYNTIWGDHAGQWKCNRKKDTSNTCQPTTGIKYKLLKRSNRKGCMVFLPPCRNLDSFSHPHSNGGFPGFQGFIPDPEYISSVLEKSFSKGKVKIDDILDRVFEGKGAKTTALNFFVALDGEFESSFELREKVLNSNKRMIPEQHKQAMRKNPALYYLYFALLIEKKVVVSETPVTGDYNLRDAMFFIIEDVWKLKLDLVVDADLDFDGLVGFK